MGMISAFPFDWPYPHPNKSKNKPNKKTQKTGKEPTIAREPRVCILSVHI